MNDLAIIELRPNLDCCIECLAKKLYWNLVDEYISSKIDDQNTERKIELLEKFLETADIGYLRSVTEKILTDGGQPIVILKKESDWDRIDIEIKSV